MLRKRLRYFYIGRIISFQITFLLLLLSLNSVFADEYYLSNGGDDQYHGTSSSAPWKTIEKLNSEINSFPAGTTIFFRRGDVFRGQINIEISGESGSPVRFDAYGDGDLPEISGLIEVQSWDEIEPNLWRAKIADGDVHQLLENEKRLRISRYPNTGYLRIDAGDSPSEFTDSDLSEPDGFFTGAKVVMHVMDYIWEWPFVTNSTASGRISYTQSDYPNEEDIGYYFANKRAFIDQENEWSYDPNTQYLHLYSVNDPGTRGITASVYDYGIKGAWDREYVSINNLRINGQNIDGVWLRGANCKNNEILNCSFTNQGKIGAHIMGNNVKVRNCVFKDIANTGLQGYNTANLLVENNEFSRIGMCLGLGDGFGNDLIAINLFEGNNAIIRNNRIDSIGYNGITINMNNALIERNIVKNVLLNTSDGGAIYSYSNVVFSCTYQYNIVDNVVGNIEARPSYHGYNDYGIYLDNYVYDGIVQHNTVTKVKNGAGIFVNANAHDNSILNNVVYKCKIGLLFSDWVQGKSIYNNISTSNVLYSNIEGGSPLTINSDDNNFDPLQNSDNNYLCNPFGSNVVSYRVSQHKDFTLKDWQSISSFDKSSVESYYRWTFPIDSSFIVVNETSDIAEYQFSQVVDLDNKPVEKVTLEPFSSLVLIGTDNIIVPAPSGLRGTPQGNNQINLNWEDNLAFETGFVLERSEFPDFSSVSVISLEPNTTYYEDKGLSDSTTYYYRIKVFTENHESSYSNVVSVTTGTIGNSPPEVSISEPSADAVYLMSEDVTIAVDIFDMENNLEYVEFYLDDILVKKIISKPYNHTLKNIDIGTHEVLVVAVDSLDATGSNTVSFFVNQPPIANAGLDKEISLPVNNVKLIGAGYDSDGTISGYEWSQISGPSTATLKIENMATLIASDLIQGNYLFQLTVTDNLNTASVDEVTVRVLPKLVNIPPSVSVRNSFKLYFPVLNDYWIAGSSTDPDGEIVSEYWEQISGPTFLSGELNSDTLNLKGIDAGVYNFKFVAVDNDGESSSDFIVVEVIAPKFVLKAEKYFSPDGNGINDYWIIKNLELFNEPELYIYDRNGKLVFETQHFNNDWNGTAKGGSPLPDGDYYYVFRSNNFEIPFTGALRIIRYY